MSEHNPLSIALEQLDTVAERLNLEQTVHERLRHPRRAITVAIPVMMDNNTVCVFTGYRVHHNLFCGPTKGGIYNPEGLDLAAVGAHKDETGQVSGREDVDMRTAAYLIAVARVAEAGLITGVYP